MAEKENMNKYLESYIQKYSQKPPLLYQLTASSVWRQRLRLNECPAILQESGNIPTPVCETP